MTRKVLAFSAAVEAATGLGAMLAPSFVGRLLLGVEFSGVASALARCFGVALLALSIASWPGEAEIGALVPALRGMTVYNGLIALYLGYLGAIEQMRGPLLWPAVALHAVVALLLVRPRSTNPSIP